MLRDVPCLVLPRWWKSLWYLERLSPGLSLQLWEVTFRRTLSEVKG